jgi:hypothetical protein
MSFTQLQTCVANTKIWKKDLALDKPPENVEDLFNWMLSQLLNNIAPLMESQANAAMEELGEVFEVLEGQEKAIEELVDQEGDFLQPEMASDLTATLVLGMFIVDTLRVEGITIPNELLNKKLQDAAKMYQQNATILLEQIKEVTVEDDEEEDESDDDNDNDNDGDGDGDGADIIHAEGEGLGGDGGDLGGGDGPGAGAPATAGTVPPGVPDSSTDTDTASNEGA